MARQLVMLFGCDAGGVVCAASADLLAFTGWSASDLVGRHIADLGTQLPDWRVRLVMADGSARDFETSSCAFISHDDTWINSVVVLRPASDPESRARALDVSLSERERQILAFVSEGDRVATIARRLYISPSTVRNHLSAIFKKLGVANQAELMEQLKQE